MIVLSTAVMVLLRHVRKADEKSPRPRHRFGQLGYGLGHVADREDDVLDRCPAGIEAGANVLADLFDLRPEIALADEISSLVAGDLPADDDPVPAVA